MAIRIPRQKRRVSGILTTTAATTTTTTTSMTASALSTPAMAEQDNAERGRRERDQLFAELSTANATAQARVLGYDKPLPEVVTARRSSRLPAAKPLGDMVPSSAVHDQNVAERRHQAELISLQEGVPLRTALGRVQRRHHRAAETPGMSRTELARNRDQHVVMRSQIVIANAKPGEIVIVSRPDAVLVTMADIPESTWADQARGLSNDQSRTLIPLVRSSSKGDMSKGKGSFEFARPRAAATSSRSLTSTCCTPASRASAPVPIFASSPTTEAGAA